MTRTARVSRPLARRLVAAAAFVLLAAAAGQALMPGGRPAERPVIWAPVMTVADILEQADTLGIADSDLYFKSQAEIDASLDRMAALGVRNVRVLIPWYDVEPDEGVYKWDNIDRVVAAADKRGMGILATVTHSPYWAVRPGDTPVTSPPADPAVFGDFAGLVAQRFAGKIAAYEVWNEPNGAIAFTPTPDAARYTELLKDAYAKIKAADPSVTVIGGILGAVPTRPGESIDSPTFLQQMYDAGAHGYFDAIAFHPYQFTTPYSQGLDLTGSPLNEVNAMRALMVAKGDGGKLIWATEYGLATIAPIAPADQAVTEEHQAAYIKDFIAAWSAQSFAGPMFIYTMQDKPQYTGSLEDSFGLYRADGTPKPAAQVVADFIAAHPQYAPGPNLLAVVTQAIQRFFSQIAATVTAAVQNTVRAIVEAITAVFVPRAAAPTTVSARSAAVAPNQTTPTSGAASTTSSVTPPPQPAAASTTGRAAVERPATAPTTTTSATSTTVPTSTRPASEAPTSLTTGSTAIPTTTVTTVPPTTSTPSAVTGISTPSAGGPRPEVSTQPSG
ncbi:cellulase family glycosylhydrolase [Williamsia serinedens]|uniref:Cellulase (Glycosyl hydrolase family 5) n=1 Tax=Williamsia serinedens TaxID=391736 RepID=A0ABT1H0F9_9NOCA|nr:cellulase family glycosylhydrolase [Williamsia serinedens]MCP2160731.1 Cellulase (glycosyl hydrolase family 5) [Williamsia serinedens]